MGKETKRQIVSKERVAEHGEVYTNEREVNAMLDLVKPETERIDSRFLEPACGDGNFMVEILRRKLAVVESQLSPQSVGTGILCHQRCEQHLWHRYSGGQRGAFARKTFGIFKTSIIEMPKSQRMFWSVKVHPQQKTFFGAMP
jgi:hypothetical protein